MLISEIFYSIQGEGELAGMPSVFIRTSGCNLRCNWCDTDYASWNPEGDEMTVENIIKQTKAYSSNYFVLTGGEPMIAKGIHQLAESLYHNNKHITIETAGTIAPDEIRCSLASISPKMSNSTPDNRFSENWRKQHERDRLNIDILRKWVDNYEFQLKFVIVEEDDINEILDLLKQIDRDIPTGKVLLMPEGITKDELRQKEKLVTDLCKKYDFRYCNRLHIELFGNKKGT